MYSEITLTSKKDLPVDLTKQLISSWGESSDVPETIDKSFWQNTNLIKKAQYANEFPGYLFIIWKSDIRTIKIHLELIGSNVDLSKLRNESNRILVTANQLLKSERLENALDLPGCNIRTEINNIKLPKGEIHSPTKLFQEMFTKKQGEKILIGLLTFIAVWLIAGDVATAIRDLIVIILVAVVWTGLNVMQARMEFRYNEK
ncbi:MAG: hypothetical protein DWQ07_03455 [Chloroflexi bacterium]|nr:MAG: hypothetical protein DWQ07_03455 [Chloroflexota bacterium]MBL1193442.1 hypothetical protein [Chloroflexota bacterium]NOH10733.1 hypothetical protein [Chloroflexota bacterium]